MEYMQQVSYQKMFQAETVPADGFVACNLALMHLDRGSNHRANRVQLCQQVWPSNDCMSTLGMHSLDG